MSELFVLTGEEIEEIIYAAYLSIPEGREVARRLAVNIREMDEYGYCADCGGARYRC